MIRPIDLGPATAARPIHILESMALENDGAWTFPETVRVDVAVRRTGDMVEIDGMIEGRAAGECARCLERAEKPFLIDVEERFSTAENPLDEGNVLSGDRLDLGDLVRQLVDAALPMTVVCREECLGLCPACGAARTAAGPHCPNLLE